MVSPSSKCSLAIVIIGILAGLVYPNLAHKGIETRINATKVQINALQSALSAFEVDNGYYPNGRDGLLSLVQRPLNAKLWHGPYIKKIPKDPWKNDYIYVCPGKHDLQSYDIVSVGPDGVAGTPDDITSWKLDED